MLEKNRNFERYSVFLYFLLVLILSSNCAVSTHQKGLNHLNKNEYEPAIRLLEQAEIDRPADAQIKRDLGVAYYKSRRFDEAREKLAQASNLQPGDGKTIFYLGLCYEKKEMLNRAISEYKKYYDLSRSKHFKRNISIRIRQLTNEQLSREIAKAVAQEQSINVDSLPGNSVAVLYFQNLSSSPELDPLQKGLTQMLITDLAKASQLKVVERVKLQKLLEELDLGTTGIVEVKTAPRIGKLIGARKLVHGGFTDLSDEKLRIDASLAETATNEVADVKEITGKLHAIFQLEKNLVFKILDELGVELTPEERLAIQKIPTESLLAYFAYSRGLDFEDRRMYSQAQAEYSKALELDPGFGLAKKSFDDVGISIEAATSSKTETVEFESEYESTTSESKDSRKIDRLVTASFAAQTGQVPHGDRDTRKPVQESTGNDKPVLLKAVIPIVIILPPKD